MSRQPPPGLQYPRIPADTHPDVAAALRNIIDNLFYIRKLVDAPSPAASPALRRELQQLITQQLTTIISNVTVTAGCLTGTHALRLTMVPTPLGTLFYETDRHVLYVVAPSPNHWEFVGGCMVGDTASTPADLGSTDVGFLYFDTDTSTLYVWNGSAFVAPSASVGRVITFIIDGGGAVITTGIKGDVSVPFNCTIQSVVLLADQDGAIVIDIWKDTFAAYPPTLLDSITGGNPPTIPATNDSSEDATLTGWDPAIVAGDTLRFNVDSVTTIQRVTLTLKVS